MIRPSVIHGLTSQFRLDIFGWSSLKNSSILVTGFQFLFNIPPIYGGVTVNGVTVFRFLAEIPPI